MSNIKVAFVDYSTEAKAGVHEQSKLALRSVAKLLRKAVKEAAPVKTGTLKSNIGTWVRSNKKTGRVRLEIGIYKPEKALKKGLVPAYYAHFIEFGTSQSAPHPFIKPTVIENIDEIRKAEAEYLPEIVKINEQPDVDEEIED